MSRTFNGNVNNRLQIGTGRTPPLSGAPLSIYTQFRRNATSDFHSVVMFGEASGSNISNAHATGFLIRGSGANHTLSLYRVQVATADILDLTTGPAPTNEWTRAVCSVSASNFMSGLVSGETRQTMQGTVTPLAFNNLCIGARLMYQTPDGPFNGDIGYTAVWNVDLTEGEQEALVGGVNPLLVRPESLAAVYPLRGGSAGDELDMLGNFYLGELGTLGLAESMLQPLWWPSIRAAPDVTVIEASLSLGATAFQAPSVAADFDASMMLDVVAEESSSAAAIFDAAMTLDALADDAPTSGAEIVAVLSLDAAAQLLTDADVASLIEGTLSLAANAGIASIADVGKLVTGDLTLSALATLAQTATVEEGALVALAAQAGLSPTSTAMLEAMLALDAEAVYMTLGGADIEAVQTLAAMAGDQYIGDFGIVVADVTGGRKIVIAKGRRTIKVQ